MDNSPITCVVDYFVKMENRKPGQGIKRFDRMLKKETNFITFSLFPTLIITCSPDDFNAIQSVAEQNVAKNCKCKKKIKSKCEKCYNSVIKHMLNQAKLFYLLDKYKIPGIDVYTKPLNVPIYSGSFCRQVKSAYMQFLKKYV